MMGKNLLKNISGFNNFKNTAYIQFFYHKILSETLETETNKAFSFNHNETIKLLSDKTRA